MDKEWYKVENLKISHQEAGKKYKEEGVVDIRGDFGSYLSMLNNGTDNMIQSHNATGASAECRAKVIIKYLEDVNASVNTMADMGGLWIYCECIASGMSGIYNIFL